MNNKQKEKTVTIPESEYKELLSIKEAFLLQSSLRRKSGLQYQKAVERKQFLSFIEEKYPFDYKAFKKEFRTLQKGATVL